MSYPQDEYPAVGPEQQQDPNMLADLVTKSRRLEGISKVGEQGVFPLDCVRVGDWAKLPKDWLVVPHIVRGPENVCGPSRIALRFEDANGDIYFPVPMLFADLLSAAYSKGFRTAQRDIRRAMGARG